MRLAARFVVVTLTAVCAVAQTFSGPALGWRLSPDGGAVSVIRGVPRAGWLSPAVELPADLHRVNVNPSSPLAIAVTVNSGTPVILNLNTLERAPVAQALTRPDAAVWSPTGTALALTYRRRQTVQIFTLRSGVYHVLDRLSRSPKAAVSDDGKALLMSGGAGLSLYQAGNAAVLSADPNASFTFLANTVKPAFWSAGKLFVGDHAGTLAANGTESLYLASPAPGRLLAIHSATGRTTIFDDGGQPLQEAACNCPVAGVSYVGRPATIQLNTTNGGPLWLADASAATPLYFVPAQQPKLIPVSSIKVHENK